VRQRSDNAAAAASDDDDDDDGDEEDVVHQLIHYWYSTWPDHQAPRATDQLLQLVFEVERLRVSRDAGRRPGPVIVHCRSSNLTLKTSKEILYYLRCRCLSCCHAVRMSAALVSTAKVMRCIQCCLVDI